MVNNPLIRPYFWGLPSHDINQVWKLDPFFSNYGWFKSIYSIYSPPESYICGTPAVWWQTPVCLYIIRLLFLSEMRLKYNYFTNMLHLGKPLQNTIIMYSQFRERGKQWNTIFISRLSSKLTWQWHIPMLNHILNRTAQTWNILLVLADPLLGSHKCWTVSIYILPRFDKQIC